MAGLCQFQGSICRPPVSVPPASPSCSSPRELEGPDIIPLPCALFFLQALVLLDVTPDQSMVDEGMAREVINRIQKLRKKVSRFLQGRAVALGLYWIYLERWGRETRQAV